MQKLSDNGLIEGSAQFYLVPIRSGQMDIRWIDHRWQVLGKPQRNESDVSIFMSNPFLPIGELMKFETVLPTIGNLGQPASLPTFDVGFPMSPFVFRFCSNRMFFYHDAPPSNFRASCHGKMIL
jgi:hypothetical protein